MGFLVVILQAEQLIASLAVPTILLARKIKHLFELDPDFKVNISTLSGEAVAADDATDAAIAEWRQKHGLFPV